MREKWKRGQKSEIARRAGITTAFVSSITTGLKNASPKRAKQLQQIAGMLGLSTSVLDWLYPTESSNPLFERAASRGSRES